MSGGTGGTSPWGEPARLPPSAPEAVRAQPRRAGPPPTGYTPGGPSLPGSPSGHPTRLAGPLLRISRASAALVIIALAMGLAVAAGIGFLIYLLAGVIHHAAGS